MGFVISPRRDCHHHKFKNPVRRGLPLAFALLGLLLIGVTPAVALDSPTGLVILEIDGNIQITNAGKTAKFDRKMLDRFTRVTINTETPWTDGIVRFDGVLARDILAAVGAEGKSIRAFAINDYSVKIPYEDLLKHDVIFAMVLNGKTLTPRNKGYLWVIYPWSEKKYLQTEVYHARSIWQLNRITVEN